MDEPENNNENNNSNQLNSVDTFSTGKGNYIDEECFNEDREESDEVEKKTLLLKPYFSSNTVPSTLYLQQNVFPLVYQALTQVERARPKDPIEFFCSYILENNKKQIS